MRVTSGVVSFHASQDDLHKEVVPPSQLWTFTQVEVLYEVVYLFGLVAEAISLLPDR